MCAIMEEREKKCVLEATMYIKKSGMPLWVKHCEREQMVMRETGTL